jgi:hypothetical protein
MELCIEKMLVVSTAHLEDAYEMSRSSYINHELDSCGWLVYCALKPESSRLNRAAEQIMDIARNQGCVWVKFDPDGPVLEGIQTYDW